jgi:YVTN family beta-propeller protein
MIRSEAIVPKLLAALALASLAGCSSHSAPAGAVGWGQVAAPVTGMLESAAAYNTAELFAGPKKFDGKYFNGVLPNGRIVKPAGVSAQIGMNPLGATLTPDGKYLITTNDDERGGGAVSLQNGTNVGGYSLSVVDTASMTVVSQINSGNVFVGLVATGAGPYKLYASGGGASQVKLFSISAAGAISAGSPASIAIAPIHPNNAGYVNTYVPGPAMNAPDASGNKPPVPSQFGSRTAATSIAFPAGLAMSPDGKYLYVACNGDNSLAVIDTAANSVVKQLPVGFFPYGVQVSADGTSVYVSNWGITDYKFAKPTYDAAGNLIALGTTGTNQPDGFYVPKTDTTAGSPKTSSVWVVSVPGGNPANAVVKTGQFLGKPLDDKNQVGDTHPSAVALVGTGANAVLYVAKANDDAISIVAADGAAANDFDLSLSATVSQYADPVIRLRGTTPNAIAVSPDQTRAYVAEAGINSVAVLDTTTPSAPKLLGRIPTGWYPTGVAVSADGKTLYVVNAKGVGEDLNQKVSPGANNATGVESFNDGNFIFGTAQKIDLSTLALENASVLSYNFIRQPTLDTSVVPAGGGKRSDRIDRVIMILHENKTFDSMLGSVPDFGAYSSTSFYDATGAAIIDPGFTAVALNTQAIAKAFSTAVNYYSDAEESDAGHQFAASGMSTDYTQKTLLVKGGRGLLVNKNFEPEDYPASGYIFNNLARHGLSFKNYGAMIRIAGTDTGTSTPVSLNDPTGQGAGYPQSNTPTSPNNVGDVTSAVQGLGLQLQHLGPAARARVHQGLRSDGGGRDGPRFPLHLPAQRPHRRAAGDERAGRHRRAAGRRRRRGARHGGAAHHEEPHLLQRGQQHRRGHLHHLRRRAVDQGPHPRAPDADGRGEPVREARLPGQAALQHRVDRQDRGAAARVAAEQPGRPVRHRPARPVPAELQRHHRLEHRLQPGRFLRAHAGGAAHLEDGRAARHLGARPRQPPAGDAGPALDGGRRAVPPGQGPAAARREGVPPQPGEAARDGAAPGRDASPRRRRLAAVADCGTGRPERKFGRGGLAGQGQGRSPMQTRLGPVGIALALALLPAAASRADGAPEESLLEISAAPPFEAGRGVRPVDRVWLYNDPARVAAQGSAVAITRFTYSGGNSPTRPFAANVGTRGALLEAGGEVGLGHGLAITATGAEGQDATGSARTGAVVGVRWALLPDAPGSSNRTQLVLSGAPRGLASRRAGLRRHPGQHRSDVDRRCELAAHGDGPRRSRVRRPGPRGGGG